jgi:hypothetical protein
MAAISPAERAQLANTIGLTPEQFNQFAPVSGFTEFRSNPPETERHALPVFENAVGVRLCVDADRHSDP